jgi:hypothetical protein
LKPHHRPNSNSHNGQVRGRREDQSQETKARYAIQRVRPKDSPSMGMNGPYAHRIHASILYDDGEHFLDLAGVPFVRNGELSKVALAYDNALKQILIGSYVTTKAVV